MINRTIDFKSVISAVPDTDFQAAGVTATATWLSQWQTYIQSGGDRPPTNPRHP